MKNPIRVGNLHPDTRIIRLEVTWLILKLPWWTMQIHTSSSSFLCSLSNKSVCVCVSRAGNADPSSQITQIKSSWLDSKWWTFAFGSFSLSKTARGSCSWFACEHPYMLLMHHRCTRLHVELFFNHLCSKRTSSPYLLLNKIWTHSLSVLMSSVSRMNASHFSVRKQREGNAVLTSKFTATLASQSVLSDCSAKDLKLIFSIYSATTW